jgi:hypothetical protein
MPAKAPLFAGMARSYKNFSITNRNRFMTTTLTVQSVLLPSVANGSVESCRLSYLKPTYILHPSFPCLER